MRLRGPERRREADRARRWEADPGEGPDRGSVLIAVPAAFLVLILLAAIAVDSAATYMAQRRLADALSAAASDAATAGLSNAAFYRSGAVALDPAAAAAVVCESLAAQGSGGLRHVEVRIGVAGAEISLRATATVAMVFGRVLPGLGQREVSAQVSASAETAAPALAAGPPPPATTQLTC